MHITAWKALSNREAIKTDVERKVFLHKKTINYLQVKSREG
jgi:hypothetical protein